MEKSQIETIKTKLFSTAHSAEKFNFEIRERIGTLKSKKESLLEKNLAQITELSDFIAKYIHDVGEQQAVKDFQAGINLLNDYKKDSLIESKICLEEDGDFGEKTCKALLSALKHYPPEVIKDYIKKGAINNVIWETKNDPKINTDEKAAGISAKLNARSK